MNIFIHLNNLYPQTSDVKATKTKEKYLEVNTKYELFYKRYLFSAFQQNDSLPQNISES